MGRAASWAAGLFASLTEQNYRLFFTGQLISVSGTWMQIVAQSFLVLRLTNSGTALGLVTATRFVPMFMLAPWGGLVADRLDKRRLLVVTQVASGLLALAFGTLTGTGVIRMWTVYLLAGLLGFVNVFDNPARQSLISDLVSRDNLRNAITLNSITVNLARVFGAAFGGSIAALLGLAWCFDVNAISFVAVVASLAAMDASLIHRPERASRARGQVRAGLRYVAGTPQLLVPLLMIAVIGALAWEFQVTLPLLAKDAFHGGVGTYGAMSAFMGVGAVFGGSLIAARGTPSAAGLSVSAIGWGCAISAAALAPTLPVEYAVLLFVGYGSITFNSLAKTTLQLAAAPAMRGRVMSLWALAWLGSTPIGGPIVGWIGEMFSARWALLAGGVPTVLVGLLALPTLRGIDTRSLIVPGRPRPADS